MLEGEEDDEEEEEGEDESKDGGVETTAGQTDETDKVENA